MGDSTNDLHRDLGEHSGRLQSVEKRLDAIETKQDELIALMHETKGGYRALILMASLAGAFGALIGKFLPFLWK